jgi:N-acetyl-anhydromuramyl-L-alanine amidase AmpD
LGTHGCGYHFVIGNGTESADGLIEVASRWSNQIGGAHCRDSTSSEANEYGIGICLVGDFESNAPTPRQIEAARSLVQYLRERYQIPAENVGTHAQFTEAAIACPGQRFPTNEILDRKPVAKLDR